MPPEVSLEGHWAWVREAMEAHQSALIRYAHCLLNDGDQARDAVQEAFIKLCRQPREKVEDRLFPWLFRVVRNQCFNMLRKEKRMSRFDNSHHLSVLEEPAQDHSRKQRKREAISSLFELVEALPRRQRELVLLKFQQDFSYREISEVTGLSIGNVGFILHQAVKSLKKQWESLEIPQIRGH